MDEKQFLWYFMPTRGQPNKSHTYAIIAPNVEEALEVWKKHISPYIKLDMISKQNVGVLS